jgi:hypothetical protein
LAIFYTLGHSNRSIEAFIALLKETGIDVVADVRTVRKSRHNPQFNADALAASLKIAGSAERARAAVNAPASAALKVRSLMRINSVLQREPRQVRKRGIRNGTNIRYGGHRTLSVNKVPFTDQ